MYSLVWASVDWENATEFWYNSFKQLGTGKSFEDNVRRRDWNITKTKVKTSRLYTEEL